MAVLKTTKVSDRLTVSPQPGREDFAALAAHGVRLVINNRSDNEEPGQLDAATAAKWAAESGMAYRHIPVRLPDLSVADIKAFSEVVGIESGPVHAHCRTGVRSVTLWALAEVMAGRLAPQDVAAAITATGFDPKPAVAWLAAHPGEMPT